MDNAGKRVKEGRQVEESVVPHGRHWSQVELLTPLNHLSKHEVKVIPTAKLLARLRIAGVRKVLDGCVYQWTTSVKYKKLVTLLHGYTFSWLAFT